MIPLDNVLVPIASKRDSKATCAALKPFFEEIGSITSVHVIEKAGGAPDKAPLEKRRTDAQEFLAVFKGQIGNETLIDTRIAYGTDIVATLFDEAEEIGATAIMFHPRSGSRFIKLLTGDTATRLVTESDIPVVSLPDTNDS